MNSAGQDILTKLGGLDIKTAEHINELRDKGVCIVIYGTPGCGKTPTVANVVRSSWGAPGLMVDCAGGTRSVTHLVTKGLLSVVKPDSWESLLEFARNVRHKYDEAPFKSYVFDNLTEIANMRMQAILRTKGRTSAEIQDWNVVTMDILALVRMLRDASNQDGGPNILMTAWEAPEKDQATGFVKRDVAFNPALARQLPGIVDIVGHITIYDDDIRQLSFAASEKTAARFRRPEDEDPLLEMPDKILYKVDEYPIAEMVATLRGGVPFPRKYDGRK